MLIRCTDGLLQEKILKGTYADAEQFTSGKPSPFVSLERAECPTAPILVLCNRTFSTLVGLTIALAQFFFAKHKSSLASSLKPASSIYAYAAVAVLNFLSTFCQYEALRYVGFTSQALAKCAKMVPVLIIGRLVYKKQHSAKQWIAAVSRSTVSSTCSNMYLSGSLFLVLLLTSFHDQT